MTYIIYAFSGVITAIMNDVITYIIHDWKAWQRFARSI